MSETVTVTLIRSPQLSLAEVAQALLPGASYDDDDLDYDECDPMMQDFLAIGTIDGCYVVVWPQRQLTIDGSSEAASGVPQDWDIFFRESQGLDAVSIFYDQASGCSHCAAYSKGAMLGWWTRNEHGDVQGEGISQLIPEGATAVEHDAEDAMDAALDHLGFGDIHYGRASLQVWSD